MSKKASVITYGCQMNVNESAKIKNILKNMSYEITEDIYEADVIFLNTCTIREGAENKVYGKLGELKNIKQKKKDLIVGLTGCLAQEQKKELIRRLPILDIVMGNQNLYKIPKAIEEIQNGKINHLVFTEDEDELPPKLDADFEADTLASISITYGCNNFCSYCIVPYVRGRERSVSEEEILSQAKDYLLKGYNELILLGQNVNSYGKDLNNGESFARLLKKICEIDKNFVLRFISPHPGDFTDELIDIIAKEDKISKCIHLPLQSGSSKILDKMNRRYTKEDYLLLLSKMKNKIKNISLTTDIIVGFPGETEEDFLDTLDVVEKAKYDTAFMFMYSIRTGTKAAEMTEQVKESIKNERLQRLIEVQNKISKEINKTYEGNTYKILVEGRSRKNQEVFTGRTDSNKVVLFNADDSLVGKFVNVKIKEARTWTLYGDII